MCMTPWWTQIPFAVETVEAIEDDVVVRVADGVDGTEDVDAVEDDDIGSEIEAAAPKTAC
jgi:hypothetical protein